MPHPETGCSSHPSYYKCGVSQSFARRLVVNNYRDSARIQTHDLLLLTKTLPLSHQGWSFSIKIRIWILAYFNIIYRMTRQLNILNLNKSQESTRKKQFQKYLQTQKLFCNLQAIYIEVLLNKTNKSSGYTYL